MVHKLATMIWTEMAISGFLAMVYKLVTMILTEIQVGYYGYIRFLHFGGLESVRKTSGVVMYKRKMIMACKCEQMELPPSLVSLKESGNLSMKQFDLWRFVFWNDSCCWGLYLCHSRNWWPCQPSTMYRSRNWGEDSMARSLPIYVYCQKMPFYAPELLWMFFDFLSFFSNLRFFVILLFFCTLLFCCRFVVLISFLEPMKSISCSRNNWFLKELGYSTNKGF